MPLTQEEVDQVKRLIEEALHHPTMAGAGGFFDNLILSKVQALVETVTDPVRFQASVENLYPQLSPQACREIGLLLSEKLRGGLRPLVTAAGLAALPRIDMRS